MDASTFLAVVSALVEHGMDLTARDEHGATILHFAAWNGHMNLVQALVEEHDVPVEAMDVYGRSAKDLAALDGHTAVAAYLESVGG